MSTLIRKKRLLPWLCFLFFIPTLSAQLPEAFYDQEFLSGFDFPMGIEFDRRGYGYVWEKRGVVHVIDSTGRLLPEPLVDISEEVSNWKDHGLTGFALDPNFLQNGRFYLLYALDLHYYDHFGTPAYHPDSSITWQATIGRVTRYAATAGSGFTRSDTSTRKVLLGETLDNGIPLLYTFHGLGSLLAADDGTLLISAGDATSNGGTDTGGDSLGTLITPALERGIIGADQDVGSYRAQYLGSYNGKILRIDAETGDGLSSNPFFDTERPRSPRSRIWALGLRNPYRIVLRPETGSHFAEEGNPGVIYAGDVGNGAWEELDVITAGGQNFGWPITEGTWTSYSFYIKEVPMSRHAKNPLYQQGDCDREYFNFRELLVRAAPDMPNAKGNPCNEAQPIPASVFPTQERLPAIAWSNRRWNPPMRAVVPFFNEEGKVKDMPVDSTASPVESELFDGFSSLAGAFYQEGPFPEAYHGKYFGVDFSGWIKVFDFDRKHQLRSVTPFHEEATNIIHLAVNPADGLLYYVNLEGEIRQISYGGNPPPVAVINADTLYGPSPLTVQFDATASYDPNGEFLDFYWDFGDGSTSTEPRPSHTFSSDGNHLKSFTVRLTVTDLDGVKTTAERVVSLNNTPPKVAISSFRDGDRYPLDGTTLLVLEADVEDTEHGADELGYSWQVFFHHNDHFHPEVPVHDPKTYTLIDPLGCHDELYWYRIELTVTDAGGLSTTDSRSIYPNCNGAFLDWDALLASADQNAHLLEWSTRREDSVEVFLIQRSTDFYDFTTIGEILPKGSHNSGQSYTFVDAQPRRGANIYRVKAVRKESGYAYSNLATLTYPVPPEVLVRPNPARQQFTVEIRQAMTGHLRFQLFDATGRRLLSTDWETSPGESFEQTLPTDYWPNGVYYYRVVNGDGEFSGRVVIQR